MDVVAQRFPQQFAVFGHSDGLAQTAGQRLDAQRLPPLFAHIIDIFRQRRMLRVALFDALEAGGQQHAERQIGVAGRVGGAVLHPRRAFIAGFQGRHPHQVGAVDVRPRYIHRRLIARHQPLVGIDPLVGDQRYLRGVAQQPGDKPLALPRQVVFIIFVEKGVAFPAKQRLVDVHPRTVVARQRLGHKGGVGGAALRQFLDGQPGGEDAVGHSQRIGVLQVDFVLAGGALVVGILHRHAHIGQIQHRIPPQVAGRVAGKLVEIARPVQRLRLHRVVQFLEIEELQLGADIVVVAQAGGPFQVAFQGGAGVARRGVALGPADVAEHPGDGVALGAPGQQGESVGVGIGPHIAFLVAHITLDGRAVEPHPLLQGVIQVVHIDGEPFEVAQNVGKPQAHEFDIGVLRRLQHIFAGRRVVGSHSSVPPAAPRCPSGCGVPLYGGRPEADGRQGVGRMPGILP